MEPCKVLLVTSTPEESPQLNITPEIQAVMRTHGRPNVDVMYTPDRIEIAEKIGNESYQILHLAGHCSAEGFQIKGGYLSVKAIASYALSMSPVLKLVIANSCSSEEIAREICSQANVDVIYTVRDQEDEECIDFAILFHSKLRSADVLTFEQAHALVDPSGRNFKYLIGVEKRMQAGDNKLDRMEEELREIKRKLGELHSYLIGDWQQKGLKTRVENLEAQSQSFELRLQTLEQDALKGRVRPDQENGGFSLYLRIVLIAALSFAVMYLATVLGNWK